LTSRPEAIFACNDRLAQAVVEAAAELEISLPVLFGFDDAPVAETLHLSTISIPWDELADAIATTAKQRLAGDTTPSIHRLLSPRPVIRLT
jgi:LacI family transcriptional regulator